MTFAEMQTEVLQRLEEDSTTPVFWSLADIKEALNDGYEEISDASEWYERNAAVSLTANQLYYDLRSVIGSDTILGPKRAFNNQTDRWLTPTDARTLDYSVRRWETITGAPEQFLMRGLWWLGFWPKPAATSGSVQVYYAAMPDAMSNDSDTPGFPDDWHYGIVEYALGDLFMAEREYRKASMHFAEYKKAEVALTEYVQKRISLDRVSYFRG